MTIYSHTVYWIHLSEHTNINTEGYIGVSNNPKRRLSEHIRSASKKNANTLFSSKLIAHKTEIMQTIIYHGTEESCYQLESSLRSKKNIGWNINVGGLRPPDKTGWSPSVETLEKRSKSLKLVEHTEDWNRKIGNANRGEKNGMFGKNNPCSDEKRLSIILTKNKDKIEIFKNAILLLNNSVGVREVARRLKLNPSVVSSLKRGTHGSFAVFPELKQLKTC